MAFGCGDRQPRGRNVESHWLFYQDVFAGSHGIDGNGRVLVSGKTDVDRVDTGIFQHLVDLPILRNADEVEPRARPAGVSLNCAQVARESRLIAAADRDQLSAGNGEQSFNVRAAHEPETDDANAHRGGGWWWLAGPHHA